MEAIFFRLLFLLLLLCSLLVILGAKCRKKLGMVMRQPQTTPEVISATLEECENRGIKRGTDSNVRPQSYWEEIVSFIGSASAIGACDKVHNA